MVFDDEITIIPKQFSSEIIGLNGKKDPLGGACLLRSLFFYFFEPWRNH